MNAPEHREQPSKKSKNVKASEGDALSGTSRIKRPGNGDGSAQQRSRLRYVAAALAFLVAAALWFCTFQSPRPIRLIARDPALRVTADQTTSSNFSIQGTSTLSGFWDWFWYPVEKNSLKKLPTVPFANLNSIHFLSDGEHGWAVGSSGVILFTSDGGESWAVQTNVVWPQRIEPAKSAAQLYHWPQTIMGQTQQGPPKLNNPPPVEARPPRSGPQDLEGVFFVDADRGWAVGDYGTILHTKDGGRTWSPQTARTDASFTAVTFQADGLRGWVVGSETTVLYTDDGGRIWREQFRRVGYTLNSVAFHSDGQRGWAVGTEGTILRTVNGGSTWELSTSDTDTNFESVTFDRDGNVGWVVGGAILHTQNGGQTWSSQGTETKGGFSSVALDAGGQRGWAVGDYGAILSTTDGRNWKQQTVRPGIPLRSVVFHSDQRRGWAVGGQGMIIHTEDGGRRWRRQTGNTLKHFEAVTFAGDGQQAWAAGGDDTITRTRDGGKSWEVQATDAPEGLKSITFLRDGRRGWAAGLDGFVLTENGGKIWTRQESSYRPLESITFNEDGRRGWGIGWGGSLVRTEDGGKSWTLATNSSAGELTALAFHKDGSHGWTISVADPGSKHTTIARTDNGGMTWTARTNTGTGQRVLSMAFNEDAKRGWAVGTGGTILHTIDGGDSWNSQASNVKAVLRAVLFNSDGKRGWVAGEGGTILHTTDGGKSWSGQFSDTESDLYALAFQPDGLRGCAAGANDTMIQTNDGGKTWADIRKYKRSPARAFYFCLALVGFLAWRGLRPLEPLKLSDARSIADQYLSDRPLEAGEAAGSDIDVLAKGLSNYLRNRNTGAPLVISITGPWGTGKSSLMNLLRGDLEARDFYPVAFNAWHHQQEEHLLAALLENIRSQGVPEWWTRRGVIFRWNLTWQRYQRRWGLLALAGLAVAFALAWLPHADWKGFKFDELESWVKLLPLGAIAAPLLLLAKFLNAFGVEPAKLLLDRAGPSKAQDARKLTSFRYQFAAEFAEVTRALRPHNMVIFIDDLDRCQPDHMMTVLESVNFLASSGECFVVLAMEENAVLDCLATRLDWRWKNKEGADPHDTAQGERREYARRWLEKLIQVRVPVPKLSGEQAQQIAAASESKQPVQPQSSIFEICWRKLKLLESGVVPAVLVVALIVAGWVIGGLMPRRETVSTKGASNTSNEVPAWITNIVLAASLSETNMQLTVLPRVFAPAALEATGTLVRVVSTVAPSIPTNQARVTMAVVPGQKPNSQWWVPVAGLLLLTPGLVWVLFRKPSIEIEDSKDFRDSIRAWWPTIETQFKTPRALKRFVNRMRFYAMLVRDPDKPDVRPRLPEDLIVGFGVLEGCRREQLQAALKSSEPARFDLSPELTSKASEIISKMKGKAVADDFRRLTSAIELDVK